ncbi:hypothetical protein AVEN_160855-1 [Araneus ventricosus]|uniref:Uncharacterized protein n=1 Tax=Araneus ventricosus TaxID=182803 RepID=A0A4Y2RNM3_ARAVE|nr:hypothetical protein AVEN_13771-1 [Araneus ventricosus]GBN77303.1 hypothetical protein AVEN_160855-1 [Araneus ventricosus]
MCLSGAVHPSSPVRILRQTEVNFKAGLSPVFQTGIFGTREGKTYLQDRKPMKFGTNGFEVVEFKRTQNPKLHPPIPIWDLDERLGMKLEISCVGEEEFG